MEYVHPPRTSQNSYISIYFGHKTLFSPNGTFRNTLKLYEITLFYIGSSAYYQMLSPFTKALSHYYADDALLLLLLKKDW